MKSVILSCVTLFAIACSNANNNQVTPTPSLDAGPGAADASYEDSANFVTRMQAPRRGLSTSPHGVIRIYYSRNLSPILDRTSFGALPEGSVAIKKQDRDRDGVFDQVMVMIKGAAGSDPEYDDWTWEQHDPVTFALVTSSQTDASFRDFCAGCHRGFSKTDWLAGTALHD